MEPNISGDLSHSVTIPLDLTASLLQDIGWLTSTTTPANSVQFSLSTASVNETDALPLNLLVIRTGDTSQAATVNYASSDVTTSVRSDYEAALGTLHFAA